MKNRIFSIGLFLMLALTLQAVPAKRGVWKMLTLADGSQVRATLVGDEHGHYWRAANGKGYVQVAKGTDRTQAVDGKDFVQSAGAYYQELDVEALAEKANVRRQQVNSRRAQRLQSRRVGQVGSYTGEKRGLVILVNFQDVQFDAANDSLLFTRIANEEHFQEGNFYGSMYDYFKAQSNGIFLLNFDIVGPVTVSREMAYYGKNVDDSDAHPGEMVSEAVQLAQSRVEDWHQYDWDNDSYVDQVYMIYAGYQEADSGIEDTIWPHAWYLSSAHWYGDGDGAVQVAKGLWVDTYACGSELNAFGAVDGIGTMCHEFSHCLGYPDFYDTKGNYLVENACGPGMDAWDLMDLGSYNGGGYIPPGYTSYERWVVGWMEPVELSGEDKEVTNQAPLVDYGDFYIIYNPGDQTKNEYFLLENRQQKGWDQAIPASGLLILHVDYNQSAWNNNAPNGVRLHQRMVPVPADGKFEWYQREENKKWYLTEEGVAADIFPQPGVTAYNKDMVYDTADKTVVNAVRLYKKNTDGTRDVNFSIEDITQHADGTMGFKYIANYTPTAIRTVKGDAHGSPPIYSLDGRNMGTDSSRLGRGLYIRGGRRITVK